MLVELEKIEKAKLRAGRSDEVTLVAATKYATAEEINFAAASIYNCQESVNVIDVGKLHSVPLL